MAAPRKFDPETHERAVRMYEDRLAESDDSRLAACRHVGELLGINQAKARGPVSDTDWADAHAANTHASTPSGQPAALRDPQALACDETCWSRHRARPGGPTDAPERDHRGHAGAAHHHPTAVPGAPRHPDPIDRQWGFGWLISPTPGTRPARRYRVLRRCHTNSCQSAPNFWSESDEWTASSGESGSMTDASGSPALV